MGYLITEMKHSTVPQEETISYDDIARAYLRRQLKQRSPKWLTQYLNKTEILDGESLTWDLEVYDTDHPHYETQFRTHSDLNLYERHNIGHTYKRLRNDSLDFEVKEYLPETDEHPDNVVTVKGILEHRFLRYEYYNPEKPKYNIENLKEFIKNNTGPGREIAENRLLDILKTEGLNASTHNVREYIERYLCQVIDIYDEPHPELLEHYKEAQERLKTIINEYSLVETHHYLERILHEKPDIPGYEVFEDLQEHAKAKISEKIQKCGETEAGRNELRTYLDKLKYIQNADHLPQTFKEVMGEFKSQVQEVMKTRRRLYCSDRAALQRLEDLLDLIQKNEK